MAPRYSVEDGEGALITEGLPLAAAKRKAQQLADRHGQTFLRIDGDLLEFRRGYAEPSVRRPVGRPPVAPEERAARLCISLPPDVAARVVARAEADGTSVSAVLREAFLREEESASAKSCLTPA